MQSGKSARGPMLRLASAMLIFGTIGVFRRAIPLGSGLLAFSRGVLGGVFLLLVLACRGRKGRSGLTGRQLGLLVLTGALIGINWILLFEAYNYTTVAVATLCYYMEPTIVLLLSPLVFRERLGVKKALCAAAAVAGMVLVSGVTGSGGGDLRGILFGLGAALFYSSVVILNKKLPCVEAYAKTTVQLLSAAAVLAPYLLLTGGFSGVSMDGRTWALLLLVGIVHTGFAYVLYFGSMDGLKAQTVAIFSYIDPVSALFFSAVLLREPLTLRCLIGAALILGAAVLSELTPQKQPEA